MANTLTGLYPIIYNAMDVVSREQIGLISAVSRDANNEQAAVDQTIRSPVVPAMLAEDITPSNVSSTGEDQTIGSVDVTISKIRKVSFNLTGEQSRGLGAANNRAIAQGRFAQAFRTLSNEIESDLAARYVDAATAYGTAGTTPFNTADDLTQASEALRMLDDRGAPKSGRHVVINSAAVARLLGKQPSMFRVNEAGSEMARRFAVLDNLFGAMWHHSGQIKTHTAGAASTSSPDYLTDLASGYVVGDTTIHLDTGVGAHDAGDVITFAGDDHSYVINAAVAGNGDKDIVLNGSGLLETLADGVVATVAANYAANMVFSEDAIHLVARSPAIPPEGDAADDRMYIPDPVSGLVYEITIYRQYRQVSYEVAIAWGVKTVKEDHLALLLG